MDTGRPLRTHVLKERHSRRCRLVRADVEFLLAEHRAHIQLLPTAERGVYQLTSTGHIGTIIGPSCRLIIRPKIRLDNLCNLLDLGGPLPVVQDQIAPVPGTEVFEFLAGRLAVLLAERVTSGLHRGYTDRHERASFLQGRLDVAAHLREAGAQKQQFLCEFQDFSIDVPCNQLLKATAELVVRSPLLGATVRGALHRCLEAYAQVRSVTPAPQMISAVLADRLTQDYRPVLDLCRLLVESLSPGPVAGVLACPAFLLDMERAFERYVTSAIERRAEGTEVVVAVQPLLAANLPHARLSDLQVRPDFTVARDGRIHLVGDVKWKRAALAPLVTPDVYQVLAYGAALGARRSVLVYPGRRTRRWRYRLAAGTSMLEIWTVQVTGTREDCTRSLMQFADSVIQRRKN